MLIKRERLSRIIRIFDNNSTNLSIRSKIILKNNRGIKR
nr:MAG TPA: hypothetical protein [Caudoviricetes sp.]